MSEIELKACPFCGGEAGIRKWQDEDLWSHAIVEWQKAHCTECECEGISSCPGYDPDTVQAWNTRASQWQPIESVPKDGTAVLVMQNNWPGCKNGVAEECNGHNTYVAAWWADERGGAGAWICYMDAFRDPECPIQPTHWQPMPPPPGVEG